MMLYRQASAPVQPRFQGGRGRNQELNNRLRTKADELERLFAEHKLGTHRSRKDEKTVTERSSDVLDFTKGEFYERYVEKRDSKLRKEWGARSEEREKKAEAMRESLERISAELKARIRRSTRGVISHRNPLIEDKLREEEEDRKYSDSSCKILVDTKMPFSKKSTTKSSSLTTGGRSWNSTLNISIPRPSSKAPAAGSVRTSVSNQPPPVASKTTVGNITRSKSSTTGIYTSTPSRKPSLRAADDYSYSCVTEATMYVDAALSTGSSESGKSRKKWGSSPASVKEGGKGIIRLLHFGRRAKGAESVTSASEGRDGIDVGNRIPATATSSSEYQPKDGAILLEQVQTQGIVPPAAPPANYKLKEVQSPRGSPRSFFSLPSFRNRGGESKLGR